MSAPVAVNTADGTCWTRRGETRGGEALYAPEGVCNCPPFAMATLAELAEHGIVGSADALPMPVGPARQDGSNHTKVAELIGDAKPASDGLLLQLGESVRDQREHEHPKWEDLFCLNLVSFMGERMGTVLRRLLDAEARVSDLEAELYTARAHNRTLLEQRNAHAKELLKLRPRVAELEAAVRAALALHVKFPDSEHCQHDTEPWPCPTVAALGDQETAPSPGVEDRPREVPCGRCGDPVYWTKSTNTDGGFWCHSPSPRPGRVLDHFGEVAGAEGRHAFEKEYQGESDAKRRLARCKHCGMDPNAPMHAEAGEPS